MEINLATPTDYQRLRELAANKDLAFEFGSFTGGSAMAILSGLNKDGRIICVDHFQGNTNDPATDIPRDEMLGMFVKRTESYRDQILIFSGSVSDALMFKRGCADLIFIDANHRYSDVMADIEVAKYLIKPGGIICGHDYIRSYNDCDPDLMKEYSDSGNGGYGGVGYGVIRAVHDHFEDFDTVHNVSGCAIWWIENWANEGILI